MSNPRESLIVVNAIHKLFTEYTFAKILKKKYQTNRNQYLYI